MDNLQVSQTLINQWKNDYQKLHDLLNNEQSALEESDLEKLALCIAEKDEIVKQINAHQLPPMILARGMTIKSYADFSQFCQGSPNLKQSWRGLMTLVENCRFKNEVNARLIDLLNQSSRRTFNLIKGFDPDNNIYNATGNRTAVRHYSGCISA